MARFRAFAKDVLWRANCAISLFTSVQPQKICFFYLPKVPDFGPGFTYFKLGEVEPLSNPKSYQVVYEGSQPTNISSHNRHLMDYTGLYALYKGDLLTDEYFLLIHYDTIILKPYWQRLIRSQVRYSPIVFSTWGIDQERSSISRWVYERIDEVFLKTHGYTFLSKVVENGISRLPNSSQFACHRDFFYKLMDFLSPIYQYVLTASDLDWRYAHLLERAWGLFFAIEGCTSLRVIADSHSQSSIEKDSIDYGILQKALSVGATKFSDVL
jgi:hypothetical protein